MGFDNKIKERLSEILRTKEGFKRFCNFIIKKGNYKGFDPLKYYQKNKEKFHIYQKQYREKNKEKIKEYKKKYYDKKKKEEKKWQLD